MATVAIFAANSGAKAGGIGGTTTAKPVSMGPEAKHPENRDDTDTVTPLAITFLSSSNIITQAAAAKAFSAYNFVFAGVGLVGKNFTP
ncbi:MAG: hypothetical protein WCA78_04350, partial [Rhizomicrobium sp.]